MGRLVDLTGQVFGQLTVLERVKIPGEHESHWKCVCTCGNEIIVLAGNLKSGNIQSCGCTAHKKTAAAKILNLTGQRFGKLVVLYMNERSFSNRVSWHCICDCGNECDVDANNLTSGHTTSCGCKRKETMSNLFFKDLTGQTFGYLTVIEPVGHKNSCVLWRCKCKCGKYVDIRSTDLIHGYTTSCGCRKMSYGEEKIIQILDDENIDYLYNKAYFKDLLSLRGKLLRCDFILFDDNSSPYRVIEFDGPQHYSPQDFFGGEEKFKIQQENDKIKNEYFLSHNIPLVRIPYSRRINIELNDLLGDKYLYKGE